MLDEPYQGEPPIFIYTFKDLFSFLNLFIKSFRKKPVLVIFGLKDFSHFIKLVKTLR